MDDKLITAIKRTMKDLDQLEDKLEDWIDDLPDDTDEIRAAMKNTVKKINTKLSDTVGHGGKLSDEAELQAHLGLMEARDKLDTSKEVIDNYLESAAEKSGTLMVEVELKAKLAQMEIEDFWEHRGPELQKEFKSSSEAMLNLAGSAAEELQKQVSKWNSILQNKK